MKSVTYRDDSAFVPRRVVVAGALGAVFVGGLSGPSAAGQVPTARSVGVPRPPIMPRAEWAGSLEPVGALRAEDDVRFLLVHHTETPNTDPPGATAARLRGIFGYHTRDKGWPDIAYNFLVDRHGRIWEGRSGSLAGPVRGDATGGSQGHALLCCFIGDHTTTPPTPAAQTAMTRLLAWLADRHDIALDPGTTVRFTSRGSNRWPAGARVVTTPIAGHRDMSLSECPGDAAYPLIRSTFTPAAAAIVRRYRGAAAPSAAATPGGATSAAAVAPSASASATSATSSAPTSAASAAAPPDQGQGDVAPAGWIVAAGGLVAVVGGVIAARRSRAR